MVWVVTCESLNLGLPTVVGITIDSVYGASTTKGNSLNSVVAGGRTSYALFDIGGKAVSVECLYNASAGVE